MPQSFDDEENIPGDAELIDVGRYYKTYLLSNGKYRTIATTYPNTYDDKGIERDIDNTIIPSDKCLELTLYEPNYRISWIVFDRDQVADFDKIIETAENRGICVGWSNPCFEIWLHAYYGSMPNIQESWTCCDKYKKVFKSKTGKIYNKADNNLYKTLIQTGDEVKAINIAEKKYKECVNKGFNTISDNAFLMVSLQVSL